MATHTNDSLLGSLRAHFAARAADRRDRLALEHDLAEFRSERDRAELDMILARNPVEDAEEVRRVHSRVLVASGAQYR